MENIQFESVFHAIFDSMSQKRVLMMLFLCKPITMFHFAFFQHFQWLIKACTVFAFFVLLKHKTKTYLSTIAPFTRISSFFSWSATAASFMVPNTYSAEDMDNSLLILTLLKIVRCCRTVTTTRIHVM